MRRTRYQYGTIDLEPRKNGPSVWSIRLKDRNSGERQRIELGNNDDLPTMADAERAAEQFRLTANPDRLNARGATFGGLLDLYIKDEMSERFSTRTSYESLIRTHIRPKWGTYPIAGIKAFGVDVWLKGLKLSQKSKSNVKWLMSGLFEYAMKLDLIDLGKNPMSTIKLKGVTKRSKVPTVLSPEQFQALAAATPEPYSTMVWVAGCLGLRCSELSGLQWGDFNFEAETLTVSRAVVQGRVGDSKTEASAAVLPVNGLLATKVLAWRMKSPWKAPTDWVFASPYSLGRKPYTLWNIQTLILKPAGKKLGLGDIGWHTLRHTYRSLLDKTGAPMGVQQKLMRHASITTTMNQYGDAYMDDKRSANTEVVSRLIN